jgi:hypothetical protein
VKRVALAVPRISAHVNDDAGKVGSADRLGYVDPGPALVNQRHAPFALRFPISVNMVDKYAGALG